MSRAREVSKIAVSLEGVNFSELISTLENVVTDEQLSSALENVTVDLSEYLTISSASSTYATNESLSAIDVDNLPDDLMTMGG